MTEVKVAKVIKNNNDNNNNMWHVDSLLGNNHEKATLQQPLISN
jgi:hypothetical protein